MQLASSMVHVSVQPQNPLVSAPSHASSAFTMPSPQKPQCDKSSAHASSQNTSPPTKPFASHVAPATSEPSHASSRSTNPLPHASGQTEVSITHSFVHATST